MAMPRIDSAPPNLFKSRGPYLGIFSKGWVPRTWTQRVVGSMAGALLLVTGLIVAGTSLLVKSTEPHLPIVFSFFVVVWAFWIAWLGIWLGVRLLAGSLRRSEIPKGNKIVPRKA